LRRADELDAGELFQSRLHRDHAGRRNRGRTESEPQGDANVRPIAILRVVILIDALHSLREEVSKLGEIGLGGASLISLHAARVAGIGRIGTDEGPALLRRFNLRPGDPSGGHVLLGKRILAGRPAPAAKAISGVRRLAATNGVRSKQPLR
jgi:hypothetical protein